MNDWIRGSRWMQGDAAASLLPPTYPSTLSRNQGDNDLTKSSCQLKGLTPRQDITSLRAFWTEHWLFLAKVYTTLKLFCRRKPFYFCVFVVFTGNISYLFLNDRLFFAAGIFEQSCRRGTPEGWRHSCHQRPWRIDADAQTGSGQHQVWWRTSRTSRQQVTRLTSSINFHIRRVLNALQTKR